MAGDHDITPIDSAAAAKAARIETFVRVLVVDDDPQARDLLRYALPEQFSRHAEFVSADTLKAALKVLEYRSIDVVLLDLGLPDCEGLETLVKLQNFMRVQGLDIPVIVLTGRDEEHLGSELVRAGAALYLVKGKIDSRQVYQACADVALGARYHVRLDANPAQLVANARDAGEELRKVAESIPPASPREHAHDEVLAQLLKLNMQTFAKLHEVGVTAATNSARLTHLESVVGEEGDRRSEVEFRRVEVEGKKVDVDAQKAEREHAYKMARLKHAAKIAGAILAALASLGGVAWQLFGAR